MLCLHCSPPTSDPRAPEQREPHSLLTDIEWTPRGLQRLSGNRWPPAGQPPKTTRKPPKAALPIPGDPRTGTPAQQAQPPRRSKCARNDRAAHQASSPTSAILTIRQPSRERPAERQSAHTTATTTAPPEIPAATLRYLTIYGEEPSTQSRPAFASRHDRASPS